MKVYSKEDLRINEDEIKVTVNEPHNSKTLVEPMHSHDFMEISYVLAGEAVQIINGNTTEVSRGDIILLKTGDSHTFRMGAGFELINCLFGNNVYERFLLILENEFTISLSYLPHRIRFQGRDLLEVEEYFTRIRDEYKRNEPGAKTAIFNLINLVLVKIIRGVKNDYINDSDSLSARILSYIDVNLKALTLGSISAHFGYSTSYFSKFFKKQFGVSMTTYVNSVKIHRAEKFIVDSMGEMTVEELCTILGYKDRKHFCSIYKEYLGMTPSAALARQRNISRQATKTK